MGCAVVDTGCNVNVCGKKWLEEYVDMLDEYEKGLIKEYRTDKCFRFGDGESMKAHKRMKIPGYIGKEKLEIETEVIMSDIPLLLSKTFMKELRVVIDLGDDRIHWKRGEIETLKITSTGHYAIDISKGKNFENDMNFVRYVMYTHGGEKAKGKALKLHRQFAHPSKERLIKLIKDAGIRDKELEEELKKVGENCETCMQFKKAPSRPIVSMPMAKRFNEMISMDLKIWKDKYFLVMIDMATRYCNACVINSKVAEVIIDGVMRHWVALFGAPRKILTDNGGEFNNEKFRSMGENFNIHVMCTAAESPWSNGTCERLNAVLKDNVLKIQEENKCTLDTALAWAVAARNALHNNQGFSPNQLVFGSNPSIPNIGEDSPVALENRTSSQIVADNLNAMRKSREEFIKADANERIRRALSRNTRRTEDLNVEVGSYVYYKREGEDGWRGPARVIGKDGKVNVVRHGGQIARAHICRVRGVEDKNPTTMENIDGNTAVESTGVIRSEVKQVQEDLSEDESNNGDFNREENDNADGAETERITTDGDAAETERITTDGDTSEEERTTSVKPKCGQRYEVTLADSNEKINVRILGRAGKKTGKYKDCYNYCNEHNGQESWMDFCTDVSDIREIRDDEEIMITISDEKTMEAKRKEFENWERNEVFEEADWEGQPTISTRWVVTEKQNKNGRTVKARLVARGFEEHLGESVATESPTCSKEALRMALAVMLRKGWQCNTIDIKTAYLQGQPISREVFLRPPPEFFHGKVWKLKKTVYGLSDAARAWYETVREELVKLGMRVCQYEPAMFMFEKDGVLEGIICIHVDDFCWGGTERFEEYVISSLKEDFLVGTTDSGQFKYVGIHINQGSDGISLDQGSYIKSLQQVEMSQKKCQRKDMPLNEEEIHQYRSVVGQLNWVGTQTRPDISFDVCSLSMRFGKCTVGDMMDANKVIKRVKTDQVSVFLHVLRGAVHLECYSDASFANLGDCGSQGGFVIFLADENGSRCPLMWKSRKVRRVVKSTLAAETLALLDAAESAFYIRKILEDIGLERTVPIRCLVDNKSLVDALRSMKMVEDKYLRINMACLKDMLSRGDISSVDWVMTNQQLANCLTKKGASPVALVEAISK